MFGGSEAIPFEDLDPHWKERDFRDWLASLMDALAALAKEHPDDFPREGFVTRLVNYMDMTVASGEMQWSLTLLFGAVAFLLLIGASPGISQSEAGRILDIQRANMAPFVARLRRRGLVDRTKVDGRSQALRLTSAGRTVLARARRIVGSFEESLMDRVPEKMRPMVLPILMALWKG